MCEHKNFVYNGILNPVQTNIKNILFHHADNDPYTHSLLTKNGHEVPINKSGPEFRASVNEKSKIDLKLISAAIEYFHVMLSNLKDSSNVEDFGILTFTFWKTHAWFLTCAAHRYTKHIKGYLQTLHFSFPASRLMRQLSSVKVVNVSPRLLLLLTDTDPKLHV